MLCWVELRAHWIAFPAARAVCFGILLVRIAFALYRCRWSSFHRRSFDGIACAAAHTLSISMLCWVELSAHWIERALSVLVLRWFKLGLHAFVAHGLPSAGVLWIELHALLCMRCPFRSCIGLNLCNLVLLQLWRADASVPMVGKSGKVGKVRNGHVGCHASPQPRAQTVARAKRESWLQ